MMVFLICKALFLTTAGMKSDLHNFSNVFRFSLRFSCWLNIWYVKLAPLTNCHALEFLVDFFFDSPHCSLHQDPDPAWPGEAKFDSKRSYLEEILGHHCPLSEIVKYILFVCFNLNGSIHINTSVQTDVYESHTSTFFIRAPAYWIFFSLFYVALLPDTVGRVRYDLHVLAGCVSSQGCVRGCMAGNEFKVHHGVLHYIMSDYNGDGHYP